MATKFKDLPTRYPPTDLWELEVGLDLRIQPKWKIPETVVIKAAVTGALIKRATNPNVPYTPDEIRKVAMECIEAGATSVHVHARYDDGNILMDKDEYIRKLHLTIDPIKEKYGDRVIIDGCSMLATFEDQVDLLKTGLLEISPVNPFWMEPKKLLQAEAQVMQENGVKPEIAIYCDGDLDRAQRWLIDPGIMKKPLYWLLLPSYFTGGTPMTNEFAAAENLMWQVKHIRQIDPESVIMVCMAGRASSYLTTMAMLLGLHVRVGMEDSCFKWPHKDDMLDSNAKVVADTIAIAKLLGRKPATANEYRALIGLPTR
jgi:3-keto-5-aminohexanoate cleavage enzyme